MNGQAKCPWGGNSDAAKEIDLAMWYFAAGRKFINYEGVFAYRDKVSLMMLCKQLAVSKSLR